MTGIVIQGLTMRRGDAVVIDELSFDVAAGEFLTLLGPSGCGKTTTLRCIAGLERPSSGEVVIGGKVVFARERGVDVPSNKRSVGMVFQNYALWPHLSVFDNIAYPLRRRRVPREQIVDRVQRALELVGLERFAHRSIGALSGGQQQRIALARAVVAEPDVLLYDEPLSNLDAKLRTEMREQIRALQERLGTTSIYVTHDQLEAATLSDRIVVLDAGTVQQVGTPREIYAAPRSTFLAEFLGYENLLPATVERVDGDAVHVHVAGLDTVLCSRAGGTAPSVGDTLTIGFRANAVAPVAEPGENTVTGEVVSAVFLGDQSELRVDAGGIGLQARVPGYWQPLGPGGSPEVVLRIDPHRVSVIPN